MWSGFFTLLLLCLIMGGASFGAGILPLTLSLSPRQLRLITALGTGVLVGTALIVIIPEGVETLYSASQLGHAHSTRSLASSPVTVRESMHPAICPALVRRSAESTAGLDLLARVADDEPFMAKYPFDEGGPFYTGPDDGFDFKTDHPSDEHDGGDDPVVPPSHEDKTNPQAGSDHDSDPSHHDPHTYLAFSLTTGFLLMYLLDVLPQHIHRASTPTSLQINLPHLGLTRTATEEPETPTIPGFSSSSGQSSTSTITLGLLIHALADGIALGASSTNPSTSKLKLVIFLALMLHKAPAAFGLTSILLRQGLSKRAVRAHLIAFSAAAPVGALATFALSMSFGWGDDEGGLTTGVLLCFSGGTFLYVAVHALGEVGKGGHEHGYEAVGFGDFGMEGGTMPTKRDDGGGLAEIGAVVLGMVVPFVAQLGGHGH
ncbi:hypothetical protein B0A48_01978 [Cryoendolithus antarcticus]|uniref:Zinc/iron permease n=1 Tax=Cryoendolithus antarcticus TaxID=1507870 RepID=A0A1V8TR37_9PEZI|nr:hypothetical protein B0A48_01978 [Cryoendolithus antarcticus]